ncbi:MFS transporter [Thermodesulfobacteriota bacterium]
MEVDELSDASTKRAVLTVAAISSFLTPFMASAINVALPPIQDQFRMNAVLLAWVQTSYLLSTAVFVLPCGRIGDIYGRKKVYIWGLFAFTFSSVLAAVADNASQLLFARILQGVGSAMIFSTGMAILTSVFPVTERGRAIGITVASVYIGLSTGPFIGGLLTYYFSWRGVFWIVVMMGIPSTYLSVHYLKGEWVGAPGEKLDVMGSILYGVAITLIMYGFSNLRSGAGMWAILAGAGIFCAFVWWERRVPSPLFNLELFSSNRAFAFSSLAALINYSATFAISFMLSLYLQYIKGLDPTSAGLVLVAQPITMALFSPLAGRLSDRIEPRLVASTGMLITALGIFGMAFVTAQTSIALIVGNLLLLGFGFALFSSPNMNAIMSSVHKRFYGVASGAVASMRMLGQMLSMGVATLALSLYVGPVEITSAEYPAFLESLTAVFLVFAGLCILGTGASLARGRLRGSEDE